MAALEKLDLKFDGVTGDHERRLRKLEEEGSQEARDALSTARALGTKYDLLKEQVELNSARQKGRIDTVTLIQRIIVFTFTFLGGIAVLLDILSRYGLTSAHP